MKNSAFRYSDELAERLMDDAEMLNYIKCAIETNDPEQVIEAIRTIAHARDHREITIRELARDALDQPDFIAQNLKNLTDLLAKK